MQFAYWKKASAVAWKATRKLVKIETTEAIFVLLLVQIVIGWQLWHMAGDNGRINNVMTRLYTFLAPFILLPGVFLWQLAATPARIDNEKETEVQVLSKKISSDAELKEHEEKLSVFILECGKISSDVFSSRTQNDEAINDWANRVVDYLRRSMGTAYVTRFLSEIGFHTVRYRVRVKRHSTDLYG